MGETAVRIAKAVSYRGAGTIEFILDQNGNFYFLEMNTRVQVEHPVTEMVTGFDIVKWMIRIASGEKLPFAQDELSINGHAIECRVYAEDPEKNFLPSPGKLEYLRTPTGPGVRNDSSIYSGYEVTPFYDPMLSKLIVWGETREEAIKRMKTALREYVALGVKTNIGFLQRVMDNDEFICGNIDTGFIERHTELLVPNGGNIESALIAAAIGMRNSTKEKPQNRRLYRTGSSLVEN
jgi:acetyl-CoA carboxylase biotin carboxylase subunit